MLKKTLVIIFLIVLQGWLHAQSFQPSLDAWVDDAALTNASISVHVVDLNEGSTLGAFNENQSLVPASTQKLISTACALKEFGANARFSTTLSYSGILTNGTLRGDLILTGGGDPSLGSKYAKNLNQVMTTLVDAIKNAGIQKVEGRIIADARYFEDYTIPRTWIWEDMGNYYGAGISALSINDNTFHLYLNSYEPGKKVSTVRVSPEIPGMIIKNEVVGSATGGDNAYIYGAPYQMERTVRGSIPSNKSRFRIKGSIPDPALFAAQQLKKVLTANGIAVSDVATSYRNLANSEFPKEENKDIFTLEGHTVGKIVYLTNQHSVNLFAEHLTCQLAKKRGNVGNTEAGAKALLQILREMKVDTRGMYLVDGSGMSRFNAVSSKQLTNLLAIMKDNVVFTNSLSVAGVSGTLGNMLKDSPAKGKLKAKSGYMERVRSYAGYVTTASGKEVAFCFIVNNYSCTASQMKRKMEILLDGLSKL